MPDQKHRVTSEPPPEFLVGDKVKVTDRRWITLRFLYTDDQGRVCKLEGQYKGGPYESFDLSQVLNANEIVCEVHALEAVLGAGSDDYDPRFSAGHKAGCLMAMPAFREEIPEIREKLKKELKMKQSDVEAILRKCNNASAS